VLRIEVSSRFSPVEFGFKANTKISTSFDVILLSSLYNYLSLSAPGANIKFESNYLSEKFLLLPGASKEVHLPSSTYELLFSPRDGEVLKLNHFTA